MRSKQSDFRQLCQNLMSDRHRHKNRQLKMKRHTHTVHTLTHTHSHTWKQLLKDSPEERKKQNQCKSLAVYFIHVLIQLSHSLIYKGKICTQWALPSTARL